MTSLRLVLGAGLAIALAYPAAAQSPQATPPPASAPAASDIEPEAVQALTRMSAYLSTLTVFEIKAVTSLDLVMHDGQKVKLDGVNHYLVRRPDGFVVEVATAKKVRRLIYDGKSLTLSAPKLGYYGTVAAPPTIRQTIEAMNARGLEVPLEDLFRWTDPAQGRGQALQGAMAMGPTMLDGVECEQYAFREGDIDWQIWIQKGDRPLPLKIVLVDRTDDERPQFEARLTWNTSPQPASDAFTFRPAKDAKQIKLATLKP